VIRFPEFSSAGPPREQATYAEIASTLCDKFVPVLQLKESRLPLGPF